MPLRTIISHPICYMVLVFLFTIGAFEYAVASLKTVRPHWEKTTLFFCLFNAFAFYFMEYFLLWKYPPALAILLVAVILAPEVYCAAKDTFYHFFYLVVSVVFVMLMAYNLAILIVRGLGIVNPGELDVNGIISTGSVMFIIAALYLFFDTRMPFIKLENFNRLIHNLRGKFLLFYFFLFDVIMVASIPFIRTLLFFDAITGKKLFFLLILTTLKLSMTIWGTRPEMRYWLNVLM